MGNDRIIDRVFSFIDTNSNNDPLKVFKLDINVTCPSLSYQK